MVQARLRFLNFEDYLAYDDDSEGLHELFNGELIPVPPESGENVEAAWLFGLTFTPIVGRKRCRGHGLELEVRGEPKNRFPDFTVIREEHIELLKRRNTIRLTMAPPDLVVEVVSPGGLQHDRDYIAKRAQYQDLGIPEYWIVDPQLKIVTVLAMTAQGYREVGLFAGGTPIGSPGFPQVTLTPDEVFS
jgi:Uma2 family endonuclease